MTTYTSQSHVAFGDTWTASNHNILLDNVAAFWTNAAQYSLPYWSASDAVGAIALANGQVVRGSATAPSATYPPGIILPIQEAIAPLSTVNAAALELVESSAAGTGKPLFYQLRFDDSTDEGRIWLFKLTNPIGTPVLKLTYRMASANTSKIAVMAAKLAAISDGDGTVGSKAFDVANSKYINVPSASNTQDDAEITLSNYDSAEMGDWMCLLLWRNADAAADTAAGDLILNSVEFQFG